MTTKTSRYDAADYLASPEDIEAYLEAALEENDPAFFQKALGTVARAKGMQSVASRANATRAGLYKALSKDGNPEFATVYRVVQALGYRLAVLPAKKKARAAKAVVGTKPTGSNTTSKRTAA
ncbi:MAG TPA: addiction module antidote protein [Xanthomonadaceae bacterium]|jgi:probable addiction module antidote protein|nr:addiction module antidote protein [Xanthomonadaceae bacterium]